MEKGLIEFSNFLEPREILKDWQTTSISIFDTNSAHWKSLTKKCILLLE